MLTLCGVCVSGFEGSRGDEKVGKKKKMLEGEGVVFTGAAVDARCVHFPSSVA